MYYIIVCLYIIQQVLKFGHNLAWKKRTICCNLLFNKVCWKLEVNVMRYKYLKFFISLQKDLYIKINSNNIIQFIKIDIWEALRAQKPSRPTTPNMTTEEERQLQRYENILFIGTHVAFQIFCFYFKSCKYFVLHVFLCDNSNSERWVTDCYQY